MRRGSAVLALLVVALLATGCGSDGSAPGKPSAGRLSPEIDQDGPGGVPARSNEAPGRSAPKRSSLAPGAVTAPCGLVSRTEAGSIAGEPMLKPIQAAQGPTCIYPYRSGKRSVTLAVQALDPSMVKRLRGQRRGVTVGRRVGVCANPGQPVLYLPISGSDVLTVAAPCALAQKFAARAMPRLLG